MVVINPAHQPDRVTLAVGDRKIRAVLLTHGHWDHATAAPAFATLIGDPPVRLNPADEFLWWGAHPHEASRPITGGDELTVAGATLRVVMTPGHTPGATYFVTDGVVFTDDTLFEDGSEVTCWDYSDFDRIIASVRGHLFILPDGTVVNTGHGPSATTGEERPRLGGQIARRW